MHGGLGGALGDQPGGRIGEQIFDLGRGEGVGDAGAGESADGDAQLLGNDIAWMRALGAQNGQPFRGLRRQLGEVGAADLALLKLRRGGREVDPELLGRSGRLHCLGFLLRAHPSRVSPAGFDTLTSMASTFTIAFPLGVTIGKWTRVFEQRHPDVELAVVRVELGDQHRTLVEGDADMAFIRKPVETDGLHVIPLYDENVVVAMHHEHLLTLEKTLHTSDLADERHLDDEWTEALFRRIAAGDGVAVLPQSVAKAFRRKDVTVMKLEDAEPSRVGLAWPRDAQHPMVDDFIGIVRGRSAHSSRNPEVAAGGAAQRDEVERRKAERRKAARQTAAKEAAVKRKKAGGQIRKRARRGGA